MQIYIVIAKTAYLICLLKKKQFIAVLIKSIIININIFKQYYSWYIKE